MINTPIALKFCSKCGENKGREEFGDDKRTPDGYRCWCKVCTRAYRQAYRCTKAGRAAHRAYYLRNKEKYIASGRRRNIEHKEDVRASKQRYRDKRRAEAIAAYGGQCACCGETTPQFLTIDHINEDGAAHRREVGYRATPYVWLRHQGYPKDRFQLLCYNCNCTKGVYGECPHRSEVRKLAELLELKGATLKAEKAA